MKRLLSYLWVPVCIALVTLIVISYFDDSSTTNNAQTPEEALEKFKVTIQENDWVKIHPLLTNRSFANVVVSRIQVALHSPDFMLMMAQAKGSEKLEKKKEMVADFSKYEQELEALLKKHKVVIGKLKDRKYFPSKEQKLEIFNTIESPAILMNSFDSLNKHLMLAGKSPNVFLPLYKKALLKEVEIQVDSAKGKIEVNGVKRTIQFKKVDGSWRLDV